MNRALQLSDTLGPYDQVQSHTSTTFSHYIPHPMQAAGHEQGDALAEI
jgi:hypothetical protein